MRRPAVHRQPTGWTSVAVGVGAVIAISLGGTLLALAICVVAAAALA